MPNNRIFKIQEYMKLYGGSHMPARSYCSM